MDDTHGSMEEALAAGEMARRERRLNDAAEAFAKATTLCRAANDRRALMHALTREAQIARDRGKWAEALVFQQQALMHARDICEAGQLAHVVRHLADILDEMGRHDEATCLYEEMTALYSRSPDTSPLELANAIRSVACHEEALGNRDRAVSLWCDLRDRYAALGDMFRETYGLSNNPGVEEADRHLARLRGL